MSYEREPEESRDCAPIQRAALRKLRANEQQEQTIKRAKIVQSMMVGKEADYDFHDPDRQSLSSQEIGRVAGCNTAL